ncbi:MAG: biopolymer transporter ExbD [Segetibacter sp.]|nr:biopolymer transporter ExbD [Segetibacter sp.]
MAEIPQNNTSTKQKGFSKSKRLSTRVDLTPMVDLGFLLITFFIFTTSLATPTTMKLTMPDDTPVVNPVQASEEKTLTLLLAKDNRLFYYSGIFKEYLKEIDFKQLRSVIIEKKQQVFRKYHSSDLVILIKVTNEANFKNIVDSLDEMIINGVSTYMLVDPEAKELEAIK